jgi:MoxR-like ATPase
MVPNTVEETQRLLAEGGYVADRQLATTVHLALRMGRPLFLEGEPGTGKTEIAKVLAARLPRRLVRLQCYDGMDLASAAYEWNHARQLMAIRLAEASARRRTGRRWSRASTTAASCSPARCSTRWRASRRCC